MSRLELTLKCNPPPGQRLNLMGIEPARLHARSLSEIARLEIAVDGVPQALGEWFKVSGTSDSLQLFLAGNLACCDYLGAAMQTGQLHIEGDAGDFLGCNMRSGQLQITGNAGRFAGSGARGGQILIDGNAGDYLAGAPSKTRPGLRGAQIVVHGNSGRWTGHRMRRGLIIVHGSVAAGLAMRMIAGTIVCAGAVDPQLGCGMRRGTILVLDDKELIEEEIAGFTPSEETELAYLPILLRHIRQFLPASSQHNIADSAKLLPRQALRSLGDRGIQGLGELVVPIT
jgi:formylmethanofuran dehydrogenase subunit C